MYREFVAAKAFLPIINCTKFDLISAEEMTAALVGLIVSGRPFPSELPLGVVCPGDVTWEWLARCDDTKIRAVNR